MVARVVSHRVGWKKNRGIIPAAKRLYTLNQLLNILRVFSSVVLSRPFPPHRSSSRARSLFSLGNVFNYIVHDNSLIFVSFCRPPLPPSDYSSSSNNNKRFGFVYFQSENGPTANNGPTRIRRIFHRRRRVVCVWRRSEAYTRFVRSRVIDGTAVFIVARTFHYRKIKRATVARAQGTLILFYIRKYIIDISPISSAIVLRTGKLYSCTSGGESSARLPLFYTTDYYRLLQ